MRVADSGCGPNGGEADNDGATSSYMDNPPDASAALVEIARIPPFGHNTANREGYAAPIDDVDESLLMSPAIRAIVMQRERGRGERHNRE